MAQEIYSDLINIIKRKALGLEVLDQTQRDFRSYNPAKEVILKKTKEIEKFSDKCGATLTLKKKYHNDDPLYMHRLVEAKLTKSTLWNKRKYILFPEFGSKNGVLHYHGIFWDMYQIEFVKLINWWRRTFGFVKMELEIRHYDCWIKYITKEHGKTGLWTIYQIKDKGKPERSMRIITE